MLHYTDLSYKPSKKEIIAEYYVEPAGDISFEYACEQIAAESSIGTWTNISTMKPGIARRLKPHVYEVDRASRIIKIAYHPDLFEKGNMPEILSSIAGNIFGMKIVKNLRLLDIGFPKEFVESFKGPRYGIEGIRKLTKIKERPLAGTIVKPKVGLNVKEHARVAYDAWIGGLDIVKDDENVTSQPFNKFNERIIETLKLRDKAEKITGEKKIYMPNITAETFEMLKRAEFVKRNGGEYVMVDILTVGFSGLQTVRNNVSSVIHAHRAMHAAVTRNPRHGMSMLAIAKVARLIGVDQLHIGTAVGKMEGSAVSTMEIEHEVEEDYIASTSHVLTQDWHRMKPVFAVASGGLHPGHIPKLMKIMGNDVVIQLGGGVHGHPNGTIIGAKAVREAIDATMNNTTLEEYSKTHIALREAINKWGTHY
jgi:ribulose-bisphosphate carboxylase large chain